MSTQPDNEHLHKSSRTVKRMYLVTGVIRCLVLDRPPVLAEREEAIDHHRETGPGAGEVREGQEDGHPPVILGGVILEISVRNVAGHRDGGWSF